VEEEGGVVEGVLAAAGEGRSDAVGGVVGGVVEEFLQLCLRVDLTRVQFRISLLLMTSTALWQQNRITQKQSMNHFPTHIFLRIQIVQETLKIKFLIILMHRPRLPRRTQRLKPTL